MQKSLGLPNDDLRSFARTRVVAVITRLRSLRVGLLDVHEQIEQEFGLTGRIDYLRVGRLRSDAMKHWKMIQGRDLPILGCVLTVQQLADWWDVMRLALGVPKPSQFEDQYWETHRFDTPLPVVEDPGPFLIRAVLIVESCLAHLDAVVSSQPSVFVGSSREGLPVAHAIKGLLSRTCNVIVWNEGIFRLGALIIEILEAAAQSIDFGILVLTPDDQLHRDGHIRPAFRDNVLFEAGLFMGALSRRRAFLVVPDNAVQYLPSDLQGIVVATYDPAEKDLPEGIQQASREILSLISELSHSSGVPE